MTFKEFNLKITRDDVLGKLLPLQIRRTYPRFTLDRGKLLAEFAGFRIVPAQRGVEAFPPVYYLKVSYPQCALEAFKKLPSTLSEGRIIEPRQPGEVQRLAALCDEVLAACDEQSERLEALIGEYNALLDSILEPEQRAVFDRFVRA